MPERQEAASLEAVDRRIINELQGGFPLSERPYADAAASLGLSENELISRLQRLLDTGVLTRFGPMFQIERMGGAFVLAAMSVSDADWDRVVGQVNACPEVAHNYRREGVYGGAGLNMWFVLATETAAGIDEVIARLEADTGQGVHAFPKLCEYFVEMKLAVRK